MWFPHFQDCLSENIRFKSHGQTSHYSRCHLNRLLDCTLCTIYGIWQQYSYDILDYNTTIIEAMQRTSRSTRWHFAFGDMLSQQRNPRTDCKSANSAQLGSTPYHFPKLHPGPCSSVGMRRQTDTQTDTQKHRRGWRWPIYISPRPCLTRNIILQPNQLHQRFAPANLRYLFSWNPENLPWENSSLAEKLLCSSVSWMWFFAVVVAVKIYKIEYISFIATFLPSVAYATHMHSAVYAVACVCLS